METTGVNGQIELLEDRIIIRRRGVVALLSQGLKGDKTILISHISSIQFKLPGTFTNGYIQFAFLGGTENKSGLFDATKDENSVMFTTKQRSAFEALKSAIESRMTGPATTGRGSRLDDLEKLAELRDKGILTEGEFAAKKQQILGL